eukprot:scaffold935_cov248-Pinguiococcus_pyrenoidosus.AAC.7
MTLCTCGDLSKDEIRSACQPVNAARAPDAHDPNRPEAAPPTDASDGIICSRAAHVRRNDSSDRLAVDDHVRRTVLQDELANDLHPILPQEPGRRVALRPPIPAVVPQADAVSRAGVETDPIGGVRARTGVRKRLEEARVGVAEDHELRSAIHGRVLRMDDRSAEVELVHARGEELDDPCWRAGKLQELREARAHEPAKAHTPLCQPLEEAHAGVHRVAGDSEKHRLSPRAHQHLLAQHGQA